MGAPERAFQLNFTCLGPLNASGANSGPPERCSGAFRLTLSTGSGKGRFKLAVLDQHVVISQTRCKIAI